MIRELISRTSCQPPPEVGVGRGVKQGQSKVKFTAWEGHGRGGRMGVLGREWGVQGGGCGSSSPAPLQPFDSQVRTLRPAREGLIQSPGQNRHTLSPALATGTPGRTPSLTLPSKPSTPTLSSSPELNPQTAPSEELL